MIARLSWWLYLLSVVGIFAGVLALAGCAETRYLTKEQDDEMRANCEAHGCKVVPNPVWNQIEQLLRQLGLVRA